MARLRDVSKTTCVEDDVYLRLVKCKKVFLLARMLGQLPLKELLLCFSAKKNGTLVLRVYGASEY